MNVGDYIKADDWSSLSDIEKFKFVEFLLFTGFNVEHYPQGFMHSGAVVLLTNNSLKYYFLEVPAYIKDRIHLKEIHKMIELSPI